MYLIILILAKSMALARSLDLQWHTCGCFSNMICEKIFVKKTYRETILFTFSCDLERFNANDAFWYIYMETHRIARNSWQKMHGDRGGGKSHACLHLRLPFQYVSNNSGLMLTLSQLLRWRCNGSISIPFDRLNRLFTLYTGKGHLNSILLIAVERARLKRASVAAA